MAFLIINGVTVPTAKGGQYDVVEIGDRQRALDGTYIRDARAFKRRWKFTTKPIPELRGLALQGLIKGLGLYLTVDGTPYGVNGLVPTSSNIVYRSVNGTDGAASADENGTTETYLGSGAICGEPAMTTPNILTAAKAQGTSTAGTSVANGATVSVSTTHAWEETHSFKVIGNGVTANPTVRIFDSVAGLQNTTYTVSFYALGTGTMFATFFDNNGGGVSASIGPVVLGATWKRYTISLVSNNVTTASLFLDIGCSLGTAVWYVDGLQLQANLGFPTSWLVPGSSRTESDLKYPLNIAGPAGYTANYWISKPYDVNAAAYQYDFHDAGITQRSFVITPTSTPTSISWVTTGSGGSETLTKTGLSYGSAWHMITTVLRYNAETGEAVKSLYFDGALVASSSPASNLYPGYGVMTQANICCAFGAGGPSYHRMDQIEILPFPVDASFVTGRYNYAAAVGASGTIIAAGDFVPDTSITVMGQVDSVHYVGYYDAAASVWRPNGVTIDFTLEEA